MAEKKTTPIVIDGKEYVMEDMTDEQKLLVNHCLDLDRKIGSAQFNLQQLQVGRDAFLKALKEVLENVEVAEEVPAETH
jgi:hypothetical protein